MDDTIEGTDSDAVVLLQNHSSHPTPPSEKVIMRSLLSVGVLHHRIGFCVGCMRVLVYNVCMWVGVS